MIVFIDFSFKMEASKICLSFILLAISIRRTEPSKDGMKYISSGFVKVLEECKHEVCTFGPDYF